MILPVAFFGRFLLRVSYFLSSIRLLAFHVSRAICVPPLFTLDTHTCTRPTLEASSEECISAGACQWAWASCGLFCLDWYWSRSSPPKPRNPHRMGRGSQSAAKCPSEPSREGTLLATEPAEQGQAFHLISSFLRIHKVNLNPLPGPSLYPSSLCSLIIFTAHPLPPASVCRP